MRQIKAALLRDPDKVRRVLGLDRARVLLCCAVFLGAALIKFVSPGTTATLRSFVFGELNQSDDYTAAFSAIGETLTDGEKLAQAFGRLYDSIFGEEAGPETVEANSTESQVLLPAAALTAPGTEAAAQLRKQARLLQDIGLPNAAEKVDITQDTETESQVSDTARDEADAAVEAIAPATLEYDYPELDPPEGTRLDYVPLSLDYTLPLAGELSSTFGYRLHPLSNELSFHNGLDIAGNEGDDVLCFADGVVRAAGEHPNLGKYYIVTHANGVETIYGHLSEWVVTEGSSVTRGQVIGKVGQSGAATGPHLHLELFVDGDRVNPLYYFDL